ncbi:hypothetical protein CC77DRAFT_1072840 [Alternaria alternata]|uniref:Uncharacterized protein n=1 Tax=Alternaria alternata TaxID=5599 RepID=A0A177DJ02_ALTAL|nr:hypothetical protein CC77DRAFT_1072840 [Alternaria alternata]OAG18819.1 hypothetical protein CC77DRAFT_1072840 [Alternaria alternata]
MGGECSPLESSGTTSVVHTHTHTHTHTHIRNKLAQRRDSRFSSAANPVSYSSLYHCRVSERPDK